MRIPLLPLLVCLPLWTACGATPAGHVSALPYAGPAAAQPPYRTEVPAGAPTAASPESRAVARVLRGRAVHDPRLDQVATRLLEGDTLRTPEVPLIDALMRERGLVEPVPQVIATSATRPEDVAGLLADRARSAASTAPITHYGIASRTLGESHAGMVLLSARFVTLDPIPRSVPADARISLRGALSDGFHDPRWVITPPQGNVERLAPGSDARRFALDVPLPQTGVYRVELLATGPTGVTVLANFPVWAGTSPAPVQLAGTESARTDQSAAAVEAALRKLITRERKQRDLPALTHSPELDAIARAHSSDMAEHDFVGHQSPQTGGPADRVRAAGLSAWLTRENLGRGYSAEELHAGLMQSPGHRDNLLSADAQRMGVGVARISRGPDPAFLATELFVSLQEPVNLRRARRHVLQKVAADREAAGLEAAQTSDALMQAAQAAAEAFFEESLSPEALQRRAMQQAGPVEGATRLGATFQLVPSLTQADQAPLAGNPAAGWLGVGVAQGTHPDTGPHSLAIVVLYGLP